VSLPETVARRLEPGALLHLYDLDLTGIPSKLTNAPGPTLYFHDGIAQGANLINFGGHTYSPFPINAEGFEWTTKGVLPRPTLTVSNVGSAVSALCREYGDLVGARLVQHKTFDIYIAGGAEAGPPWKEFTPIVFVIDRKSAENNTLCSFDLATGMDAEGITLPRRQILATACPFTYRGTECGYTGVPKTNRLGAAFAGPLVDRGAWSTTATYAAKDYAYVMSGGIRVYAVCKAGHNNSALLRSFYDENFWMLDVCLKKLSDCELHFGAGNPLPYGGFPGANKLQ